jgi:hypothetical protein
MLGLQLCSVTRAPGSPSGSPSLTESPALPPPHSPSPRTSGDGSASSSSRCSPSQGSQYHRSLSACAAATSRSAIVSTAISAQRVLSSPQASTHSLSNNLRAPDVGSILLCRRAVCIESLSALSQLLVQQLAAAAVAHTHQTRHTHACCRGKRITTNTPLGLRLLPGAVVKLAMLPSWAVCDWAVRLC